MHVYVYVHVYVYIYNSYVYIFVVPSHHPVLSTLMFIPSGDASDC